MDCFVGQQKSRSTTSTAALSARPDLEWMAVGKRAGLSFEEINVLRIRDLSDLMDVLIPEDADVEVPATQADIDAFLK